MHHFFLSVSIPLPTDVGFLFMFLLLAVRHDNYSNDWMEIVKSLRINNKSNSIERTTATVTKIELNTMLTQHRSILCTIDIGKMRFYSC